MNQLCDECFAFLVFPHHSSSTLKNDKFPKLMKRNNKSRFEIIIILIIIICVIEICLI